MPSTSNKPTRDVERRRTEEKNIRFIQRLSDFAGQQGFPNLRKHRLRRMLGPDLAAPTVWRSTDDPIPEGELAAIYADTVAVHKWVHYLPIYEAAFAPYRDRPIRMLEIGVSRGGSLRMWRRYLHAESTIVGIDIDPDCKQHDDPGHGIHVRIGGQQDEEFLHSVVSEFGSFDIVLDDGSHMSTHMVDTFRYLFPNGLAEGGLYLVEDIHANYWRAFRDGTTTFATFAGWLADAMHAHYAEHDHETKFRTDDRRRLPSYNVPFATTILDRIEIHDSITKVYRKVHNPPRSIYK